MSYLLIREENRRDEREYETFKQRMIAAHPEYMNEITDDFERARNGEFADELSEDDFEDAPRMDATSLEAALEQMQALGIAMEG